MQCEGEWLSTCFVDQINFIVDIYCNLEEEYTSVACINPWYKNINSAILDKQWALKVVYLFFTFIFEFYTQFRLGFIFLHATIYHIIEINYLAKCRMILQILWQVLCSNVQVWIFGSRIRNLRKILPRMENVCTP